MWHCGWWQIIQTQEIVATSVGVIELKKYLVIKYTDILDEKNGVEVCNLEPRRLKVAKTLDNLFDQLLW